MQGANLVKDFALQLLAAILQQRTVNIAANHLNCHSTNSFAITLLLYHIRQGVCNSALILYNRSNAKGV